MVHDFDIIMSGVSMQGLRDDDVVGTTFFIACNMMLAFTIFFIMQVNNVPKQWRTSMIVSAIITGIAFYNYTFMKATWVATFSSPTQYRYVDWLITVPLLTFEFFCILKGAGKPRDGLGAKLFFTSLGVIVFGWAAENNIIGKLPGFILGLACQGYLVYEVSAGETAALAKNLKLESAKKAYENVRLIFTYGWLIYPVGYAVAYIIPGDAIRPNHEGAPYNALNIIYNLADLLNKGAVGLACYQAAMGDVDYEDIVVYNPNVNKGTQSVELYNESSSKKFTVAQ